MDLFVIPSWINLLKTCIFYDIVIVFQVVQLLQINLICIVKVGTYNTCLQKNLKTHKHACTHINTIITCPVSTELVQQSFTNKHTHTHNYSCIFLSHLTHKYKHRNMYKSISIKSRELLNHLAAMQPVTPSTFNTALKHIHFSKVFIIDLLLTYKKGIICGC
jgi:hypothetical protein